MSFLTNFFESIIRRIYSSPALEKQPGTFEQHRASYDALWAYYAGYAYDAKSNPQWVGYRSDNNLYRHIRSIYNPVTRGVDFYASVVWPGALSEDGQDLPDGIESAISFSEDTDNKIKQAAAVLFDWWSFQSLKAIIPRHGAALGSVLVELQDDIEKGKIRANLEWPGNVVELDLDHAGNVQRYAIEYSTSDWEFIGGSKPQFTPSYVFRKEVDKTSFRYFKNGTPFDYYGNGAVEENPYGFIPAVWFRHRSDGGPHGLPFMAGSQNKIDELNGLASELSDYIAKAVEMPKAIFSKGKITALGTPASSQTAAEAARELPRRYRDKETVNILVGPEGGSVADLITSFDITGGLNAVQRLMEEIERDHPELSFYTKLREMSNVTGPAVSRMMGDTEGLVQEVIANYNTGLISLIRMAIAMGGERLKSGIGGWSNRTEQQSRFASFDLTSYERGDLKIAIMPRSLIQPSKLEEAQELSTKFQGIKTARDAGLPLESTLKAFGFDQSTIDEIMQAKADATQVQQSVFGTQPNMPQLPNGNAQPVPPQLQAANSTQGQ
jgi:hypothetical protein